MLRRFVENGAPASRAELATLTGMNRTTAYRLLSVLEEQSLVAREPGTRRYVIGTGLIALSATVLRRIDVRRLARPVMERIAERTMETVSLYVRHANYRICIDGVESRHPILRAIQLGEILPLDVGPSGKVILAHMEEPAVEAVLKAASEAGRPVSAVRAQLREIRRRGYLASVGDRMPEIGGLSVPIFGVDGVTAALTVGGPSDRWGQEAMEAAAPYVIAECAELAAQLGWNGADRGGTRGLPVSPPLSGPATAPNRSKGRATPAKARAPRARATGRTKS